MEPVWALSTFIAKAGLLISLLTFAGSTFARVSFGAAPARLWLWWTLSLVFAVAGFALAAGALTGAVAGIWDVPLLGAMWQTPLGTSLRWVLAGLALAALGTWLGPWLAALGGAAALTGLATSGHVAATGALQMTALLLVHLWIGAWWIGILSPLRAAALADPAQAARLGARFGRIAVFLVPIMLTAGAILGLRLTGSLSGLLFTDYGRVLLVKLAAVALVLLLAAMNKLRHVPALQAGDAGAGPRLATAIRIEQAAVWAVLLATAALTTFVGPM